MDGMIEKYELKKLIEEKFGDLNNDCGCYINGQWFSVREIVYLIDDCCEYDF